MLEHVNVVHEVGGGIWIRDRKQRFFIYISAKQQSHTEEHSIVHESSNHTRKNMKE